MYNEEGPILMAERSTLFLLRRVPSALVRTEDGRFRFVDDTIRKLCWRFNDHHENLCANVYREVRRHIVPLIASTHCSERQGLYADDDGRMDVRAKWIKHNTSAAGGSGRVGLKWTYVCPIRDERSELLRAIALRRNEGRFHVGMRAPKIIFRLVARIAVTHHHQ